MNKYALELDVPAGTYEEFACESNKDCLGCQSRYLCFNTKEERKAELDRLSGPTKYAIFENRPTGEMYYKPVDKFSGNWRGSQEHPSYSGISFDTEAEAKDFVSKNAK